MVRERIEKLRSLMKEKGIDAYLVPTEDYHNSEYVGEFFKCRKFITGFTGSAGKALIMQDMAGLWTDGRYFIQAEQQLAGSGVTLFKMGEPGVLTIEEYLEQHLKKGQCLGFDGKTVSAANAADLGRRMEKLGVSLSCREDLVGEIWEDRPALSCEPVTELDIAWTGESRAQKLARIREDMKKEEADAFLLNSLDDIAWLLNIRGGDIHSCPVVLSNLMMTQDQVTLYAQEQAFSGTLKEALLQDGVVILPYMQIYEDVKKIPSEMRVLIDEERVNSLLKENIAGVIIDRLNPTLLKKAVKNAVEVENMRTAHRKDGVALTRFLYWIKQNVGKLPVTELSAAEKLYELRKEQENFMDNSFDPIISYGEHAAINHYSATEETNIPIEPEGLLLCDTGGHYLEGTTDTTRTVAVGPLREDQKVMFTAVLRGMLNLADVKFREGCAGYNLDYIARKPLWDLGKDFNHGTGHGVGYYLNVHESPNSFRWRVLPGRGTAAPFEEGMVTSDEPGYYVEGDYGIRHENLIVCRKAEKTEWGQFLCFEHLTMVPFDLDGVLPDQMTAHERKLLNTYHAKVYETIAPYLNEEERTWLKTATRAI